MNREHKIDAARLVERLARFTVFVHQIDGSNGNISFRDRSGFLGREEDYKSGIAEKAREVLKVDSWKESWIGTGKIAACAINAVSKACNLVNVNQQIDFRNRLNSAHPSYKANAEQVLYDIYRNPLLEPSQAFAEAVNTFGAKYDTIAFLFFVKDDTRFLPVSTGHFDKGFAALNIDLSTSRRCSWENYLEFIGTIKEIQSVMGEVLPMDSTPSLIDAHSFVWIIQQDRFINWNPSDDEIVLIEQFSEDCIQSLVCGKGSYRFTDSKRYARSAEVVKETRRRAGGICQYCLQPAPFMDKHGIPYLEVHHVVWLSRGGRDSTENTVALCPNCHARMHALDNPEDIKLLQSTIREKRCRGNS